MLFPGGGILPVRARRRPCFAPGANVRPGWRRATPLTSHAVRRRLSRFGETKPWRAYKRYADARGSILAAGVGYFAFFSVFPAVALAFTVFGFVLRGHPELLRSIGDQLNHNLPGFVKDAQHPTGVIAVQAPGAPALTITGVIAFATLVLAGMGWLGAVSEGI